MKITYTIIIALAIVSCSKSTDSHDHHGDADMEAEDPNTILYNQVMDIHDEVMPQMEDLYNIKKEYEGQLKASTDSSKSKELRAQIANVDSVSQMMMDWMHEFDPPADTVDAERKRAYLESEMEKVKQVKDAINNVISSRPKN